MAVAGSRGRTLDPAELFLWFVDKTELNIDPRIGVAEAIYGFADQLVLKFMEYTGWLGTLDFARDLTRTVDSTLDTVVSIFTGEDKAHSAVTSWVRRSIAAVTGGSTRDLAMFSSPADTYLTASERTYFVQDAYGETYPVWVGNASVTIDVSEYDVLTPGSWRLFYQEFKVALLN